MYKTRSLISFAAIGVPVFAWKGETKEEYNWGIEETLAEFKNNLELITGIPLSNQIITLYNSESDSTPVATLSDDSKQLGFYGARDYQVLKFVPDTVQTYKQLHQMARFAPKEEEAVVPTEVPADIVIGAQCEVESTEPDFKNLGVIRFAGPRNSRK
ncbi:hypothetical protein H0H92_014589, partial [Tricholoma furcatifolium]